MLRRKELAITVDFKLASERGRPPSSLRFSKLGKHTDARKNRVQINKCNLNAKKFYYSRVQVARLTRSDCPAASSAARRSSQARILSMSFRDPYRVLSFYFHTRARAVVVADLKCHPRCVCGRRFVTSFPRLCKRV